MPLSSISNSACHGSARLTMTGFRFCFCNKIEAVRYYTESTSKTGARNFTQSAESQFQPVFFAEAAKHSMPIIDAGMALQLQPLRRGSRLLIANNQQINTSR
jgi:hypothetical protein